MGGVFGEVAAPYDRARVGCADEIVDRVLDFAGGPARDLVALEVGAGTGKATVAFASRGVHILALEPNEATAVLAKRNCERFSNVSVELATFEDADLGRMRFGLVFSAQAWRTFSSAAVRSPSSGTGRTARRVPARRFDELYRRLVPHLTAVVLARLR